jgi:hypothetical protein
LEETHDVCFEITQIEVRSFTEAPVGQPTKRPSLLDKNSPGANASRDSDTVAYAKLGAVVGAAGIVTWFGVPLLSSAVEKLLG